jgi:hypothetical protein
VWSKCSGRLVSSSLTMSIPLPSTPSAGSLWQCTAAGSHSNGSSSSSCILKLTGEHWKSWLSVSAPFSPKREIRTNAFAVFEDKELADQAVLAVEKEIHADAYDRTKQDVAHAENLGEKQVPSNTV